MAERLGRNDEVEELLRLGEHIENHWQGAAHPQGEPVVYSPTLPGGSPGHSTNYDDDSIAGAVENDKEVEVDLRDIVILHQVEVVKVARERQRQMIEVVASFGGNARSFRRVRAKKS